MGKVQVMNGITGFCGGVTSARKEMSLFIATEKIKTIESKENGVGHTKDKPPKLVAAQNTELLKAPGDVESQPSRKLSLLVVTQKITPIDSTEEYLTAVS